MIDANDLTRAFARNVGIVKAQTEGLTHEDSLIQQPRGNCLNWVIGHITADRDDILELLGAPRLMAAAGHRYERESDPMREGDPGMLQLDDLLARLDQAQERIAAALAGTAEVALAREITRGERKTTVGRSLFFQYFHETYHVGQTELFRQLAGKGDKVI